MAGTTVHCVTTVAMLTVKGQRHKRKR